MLLPDYWLPRPASGPDPETQAAFAQLWRSAIAPGGNRLLSYPLAAPRWQFLCYLADCQGLLLHGSPSLAIERFEPRQANDEHAFGNQKAVYAAGDGLWALYYAILDRARYPMSLNNACIRLADSAGNVGPPHYFFSISQSALAQRPWCSGAVYVLPPDTFVLQPPIPFGPYEVRVPQYASREPVTPLARVEVGPDDFPFLAQIRGHDDSRWSEYVTALRTGAPWPDG